MEPCSSAVVAAPDKPHLWGLSTTWVSHPPTRECDSALNRKPHRYHHSTNHPSECDTTLMHETSTHTNIQLQVNVVYFININFRYLMIILMLMMIIHNESDQAHIGCMQCVH